MNSKAQTNSIDVKKLYWISQAKTLIGARSAELEEWAYDAKVELVANALQNAHAKGREAMRAEVLIAVSGCIARDSTLIKLQQYIMEL